MKMSQGISLHVRSGKISNAAESYAPQMSAENRPYTIRNILTEAAKFRCQIYQFSYQNYSGYDLKIVMSVHVHSLWPYNEQNIRKLGDDSQTICQRIKSWPNHVKK